jgi:hypothetical protein
MCLSFLPQHVAAGAAGELAVAAYPVQAPISPTHHRKADLWVSTSYHHEFAPARR